MTPAEFVEAVVIPTVQEYFAHPVNLRRMYVACVVTDHVTEYVSHATGRPKEAIRAAIRATCGTPFDIVRGISVARKHPESSPAKRFQAGQELVSPGFGFAEAQQFVNGQPTIGGFGHASFGPPRLYLVEDGKRFVIDICVRSVVLGFVTTFPEQLGAVDVSYFHPPTEAGTGP